jgi:uncharacterized protein (TIGR02246 family)
MTEDERAIRELVSTWMAASKAGDTETVLSLIADDAEFMVVGQEPFGKDVFRAAAQPRKDMAINGTSDIREIQVLGDWAWLRNYLTVTVTPPGGAPIRRAGWTLAILRRTAAGKWVLVRDANLMTTVD